MVNANCGIGGGCVAIKQIVGQSGAGLTRHLTELYENTAGAVMLTSDPRAHITYLRPTVEEELAFGLEQRGIEVDEMRRRITAIARALNLDDLLDRAPNQLSGGQTRRLALGTVLILDAPLVLLDDPFAGLDPTSRDAVSRYIHTLAADVVVAGHQAWLGNVDTQYLGQQPVLKLPEPVNQTSLEDQSDFQFPDVVGRNGSATRRWWQFRKLHTNQFEIGPLTLSVPRGGVLWLRGANGTGKTTLMKALVERDSRIGLMLQDPIDQVIDSRVEQMVPDAQLRAQFDLDGEEHPLDLSQRALRLAQFASVIGADNGQRVEVLCADEPDVGLDITGRSALHAGFASHLQRGGGIVLACHDENFIEELRIYAQVELQEITPRSPHAGR